MFMMCTVAYSEYLYNYQNVTQIMKQMIQNNYNILTTTLLPIFQNCLLQTNPTNGKAHQ